jgi:hypothetical protein
MKASSKAITPKKGDRFSFPEDFKEHPKFQELILSYKEFNLDNYARIRTDDDKTLIRIYTPHFAHIFSYPDFELYVGHPKKLVKILTYPLFSKFKEGYLEGIKFFEETYKVSQEVIYGVHSQVYERTLHQKFYHPEHGKISGEWSQYEKSYPIVFDFEILYDYGYYSGLISCIKDLIKLHPVAFQNFDKCSLNAEHKKDDLELIPTDPILAKILKHLKPLKGYWGNERILSENEFSTLLNNIKYVYENKKLPLIKKKIANTPVTNQFILKTFSNINKEFFHKKRNALIYELIKKTFNQFKETTLASIQKNFTTYDGHYINDVKNISYKEEEGVKS